MTNMTQKVKTNIEGFDELVGGGLPKGCCVLLSGTPGTGKTIFALQFLYNGATAFNERGIYVTFEENVHDLRKQAQQFGWDLEKAEKEGKLLIMGIQPKDIKDSSGRDIIQRVMKGNYERVVIDSLSALAINTPNTFGSVTDLTEILIKRFMYHFISEVRKTEATTLFVSQITEKGQLSSDQVSEFICDGIIYLTFETLGGPYSRSLLVRKMRKVRNDEDIHPLEISEKGIVVHNLR